MFALQLSPAYREASLELVNLRRESRQMRDQFKEKDVALKKAEKKLMIISAEAIKRKSDSEAETLKRQEAQTQLSKAESALKEKAKIIERIELERGQVAKQLELQEIEIEKLKKEHARVVQQRQLEKKEFEAKNYECESFKSDSETCKDKYRDVKNELERLKLEHAQAQKESAQKEQECNALKQQMDERNAATTKLVKKVEQADLEKLLDTGEQSSTGSTIDKEELASLLTTPPPQTPAPETNDAQAAANNTVTDEKSTQIVKGDRRVETDHVISNESPTTSPTAPGAVVPTP